MRRSSTDTRVLHLLREGLRVPRNRWRGALTTVPTRCVKTRLARCRNFIIDPSDSSSTLLSSRFIMQMSHHIVSDTMRTPFSLCSLLTSSNAQASANHSKFSSAPCLRSHRPSQHPASARLGPPSTLPQTASALPTPCLRSHRPAPHPASARIGPPRRPAALRTLPPLASARPAHCLRSHWPAQHPVSARPPAPHPTSPIPPHPAPPAPLPLL